MGDFRDSTVGVADDPVPWIALSRIVERSGC